MGFFFYGLTYKEIFLLIELNLFFMCLILWKKEKHVTALKSVKNYNLRYNLSQQYSYSVDRIRFDLELRSERLHYKSIATNTHPILYDFSCI